MGKNKPTVYLILADKIGNSTELIRKTAKLTAPSMNFIFAY